MKLRGTAFHPVDRSLMPEDLKSLPRASRRMMEVIVKGTPDQNIEASSKSWSLDSCLSPIHFLGHADDPTLVASTAFAKTKLVDTFDPFSRIQPTDETVMTPSDVVFRSVGYRSVALPGFREAGIQFDDSQGVVSNDGLGRVTRLVSKDHADHVGAQQVPGLYCAGWLKRGPTGVIASTMQDAFATGDAIAQDWLTGAPFLSEASLCSQADGWAGLKEEIGARSVAAVSWDQWRLIDSIEKARGEKMNKTREKFTNTQDMLAALA